MIWVRRVGMLEVVEVKPTQLPEPIHSKARELCQLLNAAGYVLDVVEVTVDTSLPSTNGSGPTTRSFLTSWLLPALLVPIVGLVPSCCSQRMGSGRPVSPTERTGTTLFVLPTR